MDKFKLVLWVKNCIFLHICFHDFRYTRERKFYSDRGLPCPKDQALEEENDKKEEEHEPNTPGENIRLFDSKIHTTCFCS